MCSHLKKKRKEELVVAYHNLKHMQQLKGHAFSYLPKGHVSHDLERLLNDVNADIDLAHAITLSTYRRDKKERENSGVRTIDQQIIHEALALPWLKINQYIGPDYVKSQVIDAAETGQSLLLLGEPGNGKSHLAKSLAELLAIFGEPQLVDLLCEPNPEEAEENKPLITAVPVGSLKEYNHFLEGKNGDFFLQWRQEHKDAYRFFQILAGVAILPIAYFSYDTLVNAFELVKGTAFAGGKLVFDAVVGGLATALGWGPLLGSHGKKPFSYFFSQKNKKPKKLVDNSDKLTPPCREVTGAETSDLFGYVRHDPYQSGGLGTPAYKRVEAGEIHKAHKGVLVIDEARSLNEQILNWLLTAWEDKSWPIRSLGSSGSNSAASVSTAPAPCDFRLVMATNNLEGILANPAFRSRLLDKAIQVIMPVSQSITPENLREYAYFPLSVYEDDLNNVRTTLKTLKMGNEEEIKAILEETRSTLYPHLNKKEWVLFTKKMYEEQDLQDLSIERQQLVRTMYGVNYYGELSLDKLFEEHFIPDVAHKYARGHLSYKQTVERIVDDLFIKYPRNNQEHRTKREENMFSLVQDVMYIPWTREAVIEMVEWLKSWSPQDGHVSTQLRPLKGVIRSARDEFYQRKFYAQQEGNYITHEHFRIAIEKKKSVEHKHVDKLNQMMENYKEIMTSGLKKGQVNALAVIPSIYQGLVSPILSQAVPKNEHEAGVAYIGRIQKEKEVNESYLELSLKQVDTNLLRVYNKPLDKQVRLQFYDFKQASDGDSATLALTIAGMSALYNARIDQSIGLTSSMNVHGELKEVGGVKWKIEGAMERGLKKVIISEKNAKDIILDSYKGKIDIIPCKYMEEAALHLFPNISENEMLRSRLEELLGERTKQAAS